MHRPGMLPIDDGAPVTTPTVPSTDTPGDAKTPAPTVTTELPDLPKTGGRGTTATSTMDQGFARAAVTSIAVLLVTVSLLVLVLGKR